MGRTDEERVRSLRRGLFLAGLAVAVCMVSRSQVGRDQFEFLLAGWSIVADGIVLPYGNAMSGGGVYPGPLVGILAAIPLAVFEDHRSVAAFVLLSHVAAYLLFNRGLRPFVGERGLLVFCLVYWLNPWRLYYSGHTWNPNWMPLVAAVYFITATAMRRDRRFLPTFVHVGTVGLAFQVHASAVVLAVATCVLLLRRRLVVHWGGAIAGGVVTALGMLPYFFALARHPEISPMHHGFFGRGVVYVYPLVRGVLYWVRMSSLFLGRRILDMDFTALVGSRFNALAAPAFAWAMRAFGAATFVVALRANVRLWRRRSCRGRGAGARRRLSDREWLESFVRCVFVAAAVTFAISPTTVMVWQLVVTLPFAVLPLLGWWLERWDPHEGRVPVGMRACAAGLIVVGIGLAAGSPLYRTGGENPHRLILAGPHPMIDALGIARDGAVTIDPVDGIPVRLVEAARRNDRGPRRTERSGE